MTLALMPISVLLVSCSPPPEPVALPPVPNPLPAVEPGPAPAPAPAPRPAVTIPSEPALSSFTGQATHLGAGHWCAFYPLGWSDDGRFAWATERRANDMAIEYGASWRVRRSDESGELAALHHGSEAFPEDATLAWAWAQRQVEVDALLAEHGILAGGTTLTALPADTPAGRLEARWTIGVERESQRPGQLELLWPDGRTQSLWQGDLPTLAGEPALPSLIRSPSGTLGVLVLPLVTREPVEALVDVDYMVFGLSLDG